MRLIRGSAAASFLIGILVGAAILNLICGKHIDDAEMEIQRLNTKLADQTEQITALQKNLEKRQKSAITEIEVQMIYKDDEQTDEYTKLELEKIVKKLLKNIRGKEVSSLDPLLITNIIDGRTVEVTKRRFFLSVKGLLISQKLIIHIEVTEKPQVNLQSTG